MISVIIPCYNHAQYLPEAINSVLEQTYSPVEIIVVNDGSVDDTEAVARRYPVKYVSQPNSGLSAARNKGIDNSTGEYLVFLDADDWLYKDALATNYTHLRQNPEAVFVSGGHDKIAGEKIIPEEDSNVQGDHYLHLLQGNYIGMHAAVMYRRSIFNEFRFDESLRACEDYDLYLKIARKYPVIHHTKKIAAYRRHQHNMSGDTAMMLSTVTKVLRRQEASLRSGKEKEAFRKGLKIWKEYYHKSFSLKKFIKKNAPGFVLRALRKNYIPVPGKVNTGDLKRLTPFSFEFGYDRGGPVDRYYIENFLQRNSNLIKGRVLEIGDNYYTTTYGGNKVQQSDVLHVDDSNPAATFTGDLSNAPFLPDNSFDCIVLTQTLHLIYDFKAALQTCHRVLKPGGCLLLTVPGITPIDHGEWKKTWYWSFTKAAMIKLMHECFPEGKVSIENFGNIFVATAFLYGMGLPELDKNIMDHADEHYPVIITAAAIK
ncbi:MAG TPA: glycosyltransferase [Chitinophagaceae bacterium]|nr:glycosyltransferase [Chitinophagaceae bacterium]